MNKGKIIRKFILNVLYFVVILSLIAVVGFMVFTIININNVDIEETTGYATVEQCFKREMSMINKTNISYGDYEYVTVLRYNNKRINILDMNTYTYCYDKINERVLCKINITHYKFPFNRDPEYNIISIIR